MLAVDLPTLGGGEDAAEGIGLTQPLAFITLVEKDGANFLPRLFEEDPPFACGGDSSCYPALTNLLRVRKPRRSGSASIFATIRRTISRLRRSIS